MVEKGSHPSKTCPRDVSYSSGLEETKIISEGTDQRLIYCRDYRYKYCYFIYSDCNYYY